MNRLIAPVDNRRRRIQQLQERSCDKRSDDHDEDGSDQCQRNAYADCFGQLFPLARAEVLRHHDAGTGGNSHEQHQHEIQNRSGAADRGQRVVADKPSDDNGVGRIVELLGNVAD